MKPVPNPIPEDLPATGAPLTAEEDIRTVGKGAGRVAGSAEEEDPTGIKALRIKIRI